MSMDDEISSQEFTFRGRLVAVIVLRTYEGDYRLSTTFGNGKTVSKVFTDLDIALGTYAASVLTIEDEINKAGGA